MNAFWSGVAVSLFALAGVASAAHPAGPAAAGLVEDKGKFVITVGGQPVGSEDFQISRDGGDWVAHGSTEIHSGSDVTRVNAELRMNSAGEPLHYTWASAGGKKVTSTTDFQGLNAKITLDLGDGNPIHQDYHFASPVVVLDNNLYHQYEILAHDYNWATGGPQSFSVLIPQEQSPGTITVESLGPVTLDGAKYNQLVVRTLDLQVNIYLDSSHKLMRLTVPASKAEVRRQ